MDLEAAGLEAWHWWQRFRRPQLAYLRLLRRVEYWSCVGRRGFLMYAVLRLRLARQSQRLGLSIPPGVFGPGLMIPHYGTIVVNDKARFGAYCRLHTSTNIGERHGRAPEAGDFVYVAPGAVLSGGITIGTGALIGANAVVLSDVPPGTTAAGAPSKVVNDSSGSERVMPGHIRERMTECL